MPTFAQTRFFFIARYQLINKCIYYKYKEIHTFPFKKRLPWVVSYIRDNLSRNCMGAYACVCVCVRVIEDRHRDIENAVVSPLLVLHLRFTMPYLRIDKSRDKMKNNASHPSFYCVKWKSCWNHEIISYLFPIIVRSTISLSDIIIIFFLIINRVLINSSRRVEKFFNIFVQ